MQGLKEILVETTGGDFPAHTYYLNSEGKLIAFKKCNDDTIKVFSKPLMFSKTKRKFKKVSV
jgi:hypothetical protein